MIQSNGAPLFVQVKVRGDDDLCFVAFPFLDLVYGTHRTTCVVVGSECIDKHGKIETHFNYSLFSSTYRTNHVHVYAGFRL